MRLAMPKDGEPVEPPPDRVAAAGDARSVICSLDDMVNII